MDLVFAEEKYSKSGQLEKVRQHFWKRTSSFIPDVISQEIGAINQAKGTILLVWQELCFPLKRGSGVFTFILKPFQTLFLLFSSQSSCVTPHVDMTWHAELSFLLLIRYISFTVLNCLFIMRLTSVQQPDTNNSRKLFNYHILIPFSAIWTEVTHNDRILILFPVIYSCILI